MKRVFMIMLLLALGAAACAQGDTVEYISHHVNQRWVCETFEAQMNADAQEAFADRLLPSDEIVCGAELILSDRENTGRAVGKSILMALRRDGKMLMMAADWNGQAWTAAIESDSFLPADGDFALTAAANCDADGHVLSVSLAALCGAQTWRMIVLDDAGVQLQEYSRTMEDGAEFVIHMQAADADSSLGCSVRQGGLERDEETFSCVFPDRIAAWTMEAFPKTREALRDWAHTHQPQLQEGEGYLNSVNLRERPTGQSTSLGVYRAKARVLGSEPGEKYPWYHVQVGDTLGWVSGRYLHTGNDRYLCEYEREMLPVALAGSGVVLQISPDGEVKQTLAAGTLMHVICERDGWLHVVVPRGEICWKTDWAGTYGFVPAGAVTLGTTAVDVLAQADCRASGDPLRGR